MSRTLTFLSWLLIAVFWVAVIFFTIKNEAHAQTNGSFTVNATNGALQNMDQAPQNVDGPNGINYSIIKGTYPDIDSVLEGPYAGPAGWGGFNGITYEAYGAGAGDYWFQAYNETSNELFVFCLTSPTGTDSWTTFECQIGPPPPTSDFNEVLDYIYDPDLNNTFGTSTVGADFNIAQPSWVSYVGVSLRDPNGQIVWNATTTTPDAGLYTVDTDYYFDTTGVYELQAYFYQTDIGIVNNPVSLLITVNVPTWTFDPVTGDLVPSASTTVATSTLLDFKVECDTGSIITDGACKLITAFFVPKASTVQNVQVAFNSVMQKAPFSFFTQSKTILDSFRLGTASSGGTFSLEFYGETVPIVSSTTASNVGLTTDIIDFFKMLMTVGLWLMLAWYLYWRIASIFGV